MEAISLQSVTVADGNKIPCQYVCRNFVWQINGKFFTTDVLLIPIGSCDMVLGIQWLRKLGEIHWDFHNMIMKFEVEGQHVCLKGITNNTRVQVVEELSQKASCAAIQFCLMQVTNCHDESPTLLLYCPTSASTHVESKELLALKTQFQHVFHEPGELPPSRGIFDHIIPIEPNAKPINIRPYRYPLKQRDVIETSIHELLDRRGHSRE